VLLVTTSVRVIDGIHCYTSNLGPFVSLGLVFVECTSGFKNGLISTSTTGAKSDHGTARNKKRFLGSRRKTKTGDTLIGILRHNNSIVSGSTGNFTAVSRLSLNVADNSSLGNLSDREDISDGKSSY
jgi:hypothetical protein